MPELQKLHLKPLGHPTITKVPVNRQELHLRGKYSAYLRLRDTGIKRPFTGPLYTIRLKRRKALSKGL